MSDVLQLTTAGLAPYAKMPALPVSPRVRAMADEKTMASAPTITVEATGGTTPTNSPTVLSGTPVLVSSVASAAPATTKFRFPPLAQVFFTTAISPRSIKRADGAEGTTATDCPWFVEFDITDIKFEIPLLNAGGTYRLWCNEEIAGTITIPNDGKYHAACIDFTSAGGYATRRFRLEMAGVGYFAGVRINATGLVMPPSTPRTKRLAIVGDSYSVGYTTSTTTNIIAGSFAARLARLLGFNDVSILGKGGSGFIAAQVNHLPYGGRISDLVAVNPDYVVVEGTLNDVFPTYSASAYSNAVTSYMSSLRSLLPGVPVVYTGGIHIGYTNLAAGFKTDLDASITAMAAAAAAAGVPFIDTTGWGTLGTGYVGATTGNGPSDFLAGTTGDHPSDAGHMYLARRLAPGVAAALNLN